MRRQVQETWLFLFLKITVNNNKTNNLVNPSYSVHICCVATESNVIALGNDEVPSEFSGSRNSPLLGSGARLLWAEE